MASVLEQPEPRWWFWENPAPNVAPNCLGPLPAQTSAKGALDFTAPPPAAEVDPALVGAHLQQILQQQTPEQAEEMLRCAFYLDMALAAQSRAATPPATVARPDASSPSRSCDGSTRASTEEGAASPSAEELRVVEAVYEKYLRDPKPDEPAGTTLMCHDLLNKFKVEPDLLQIFEDIGVLDAVEYVYLPLTYLKTGTAQKVKKACRNKGYCFVHFSDPAAADTFSARVGEMAFQGTAQSSTKHIHSTPAKFQGVGANLVELLDLESDQFRARVGYFHVRVGGVLECVGLSTLRSFVETAA